MIEHKDISFTNNGYVICKGVQLVLTRENIEDYKAQTGMDAIDMIEWTYNNTISVIRDRKLEELLP